MFFIGLTLLLTVASVYGDQEDGVCCLNSEYKVPSHSCACSSKTAGTLRYHDNQIQFCNGEIYVDVGSAGKLGSETNPAKSCRQILDSNKHFKSGVYYLDIEGEVIKTYCYMEEICGSKGWTLIMKIDGSKTTFTYNSAYWTNEDVYNPAGATGGLDNQETKLETYSDLPFDALCLGMKSGNDKRWLKLSYKAPSLYSVIKDNKYKATTLKRDQWKSLIKGSSLQKYCNKEGFNVKDANNRAMARIGIIGNNEKNCYTPDSRIGYGTGGKNCRQNPRNSAGNEGRCYADNGDKSIKAMGYILAQ